MLYTLSVLCAVVLYSLLLFAVFKSMQSLSAQLCAELFQVNVRCATTSMSLFFQVCHWIPIYAVIYVPMYLYWHHLCHRPLYLRSPSLCHRSLCSYSLCRCPLRPRLCCRTICSRTICSHLICRQVSGLCKRPACIHLCTTVSKSSFSVLHLMHSLLWNTYPCLCAVYLYLRSFSVKASFHSG